MAFDDEIDDDEGEKKPKKKSKLLLIIVIIFSTLLLIAISVGATLYLGGVLTHEDSAVAAEGDTGQDTHAVKKKKHTKKKKHVKKKEGAPPLYVELGDPLVVNFVENNQIRYLQVKMEVMTVDESIPEKIKTHMPLIRNNLLMMLSGLDYETISSLAGKKKIRAEALAEIQNILKEKTGSPGVEEVYFTSFVMQ